MKASLFICLVAVALQPCWAEAAVKLKQVMTFQKPRRIEFDAAECSKTFLRDYLDENTGSLPDSNFLLDTQTGVNKDKDCALECCGNDQCCKAVYTKDSQCLLYGYVKDADIPFPDGSTLLREECCYDGEREMGEVTLHTTEVSLSSAVSACSGIDKALVKPMTLCAYTLITVHLAEIKQDVIPDNTFWFALRNPTTGTYKYPDDDSTPQFELPMEPAENERGYESKLVIWRYNGNWVIADTQDDRVDPYMCQSKTS